MCDDPRLFVLFAAFAVAGVCALLVLLVWFVREPELSATRQRNRALAARTGELILLGYGEQEAREQARAELRSYAILLREAHNLRKW